MAHIPGRLPVSPAAITRVPLRGNVVQRLGVGVREKIRNIAGATLRGYLQGVVIGVPRVLQVSRLCERHNRTAAGVRVVGADGLVVDRAGKATVEGLAALFVDATFSVGSAPCEGWAERRIAIIEICCEGMVVPMDVVAVST